MISAVVDESSTKAGASATARAMDPFSNVERPLSDGVPGDERTNAQLQEVQHRHRELVQC
jgi:hypothetical protein